MKPVNLFITETSNGWRLDTPDGTEYWPTEDHAYASLRRHHHRKPQTEPANTYDQGELWPY